MVELNLEHVLILAIVVFLLYHFVSRCNCFNSNSFSVGGHPDCIATADSVLNNAQCNALGINEAKCRDDTNNFCKWVGDQKQEQLSKIDPSIIEDSPYPTDSCEGRYATIYVGTYMHFFREDKDVEANAREANIDVPPSDNFDDLGNFKDITKVETYINHRYNDELKYLRDNCNRESLGNGQWCIASRNSSIICDIIWQCENRLNIIYTGTYMHFMHDPVFTIDGDGNPTDIFKNDSETIKKFQDYIEVTYKDQLAYLRSKENNCNKNNQSLLCMDDNMKKICDIIWNQK